MIHSGLRQLVCRGGPDAVEVPLDAQGVGRLRAQGVPEAIQAQVAMRQEISAPSGDRLPSTGGGSGALQDYLDGGMRQGEGLDTALAAGGHLDSPAAPIDALEIDRHELPRQRQRQDAQLEGDAAAAAQPLRTGVESPQVFETDAHGSSAAHR